MRMTSWKERINKMDKTLFISLLIEAVVFLIPVATLFIKTGKVLKEVEILNKRTENLPEWKAATDTKVTQLELQTIAQQHTLEEINKNIYQIGTKMDLLLSNKLKLEKE